MSHRTRSARFALILLGIGLLIAPVTITALGVGDPAYEYHRTKIVATEDRLDTAGPGDRRVLDEIAELGCAGEPTMLCAAAARTLLNHTESQSPITFELQRPSTDFQAPAYIQLDPNGWESGTEASRRLYTVDYAGSGSTMTVRLRPTNPAVVLATLSQNIRTAPEPVQTALQSGSVETAVEIPDQWLGTVVVVDNQYYVVTGQLRYAGWDNTLRAVIYGLFTFFGLVSLVAGRPRG